ncbi:MAG: DUF1553 domain-containing protein, partial [Planctomycetales bacterium]|nr:DUF1553 domain-containing protein [Planctomycetales bacterium]
WAAHFGQGLVPTTSDFDTRAAPPSHPELLDWLATRFIAEGWSVKQLQRWIVLSATYQQSSQGPTEASALAQAQRQDPENRLLWRSNARRLSFEELRDSLLVAAGELDRASGGKPSKLFAQPFPTRRTLYGLVDRQFLPNTLRMFDFANPDLHVAERSETTVPQQALFFMNHPLVLEQARALAGQLESVDEPVQRLSALFEAVLQRRPTAVESADALAWLEAAAVEPPTAAPPTAADWQYGYGAVNAEGTGVVGFTPLPHSTGQAWQGSGQYPDSALGWVQLTAQGGHPGNDLQHAAVRRWTATDKMTIRIESKINHEPQAGDGIRAFILSSQGSLRQSLSLHHQQADLSVAALPVSAGETIDFVVDIGGQLNSDQFLWEIQLQELQAAGQARSWNSATDFAPQAVASLAPWEQLVQVLLCSNEFLFVD